MLLTCFNSFLNVKFFIDVLVLYSFFFEDCANGPIGSQGEQGPPQTFQTVFVMNNFELLGSSIGAKGTDQLNVFKALT
jgi:hypothetical protein